MASVLYQNAVLGAFENTIDWETDTIKGRLLMTNTTADDNPDADTCADLTLDECDDTGSYAPVALDNVAATAEDGTDLFKWDSDDVVFSGLNGDASRDYQGMLLVKYVDDGNGDIPLLFVDFTSDVALAATQVTVPGPATGWLTIGQPA